MRKKLTIASVAIMSTLAVGATAAVAGIGIGDQLGDDLEKIRSMMEAEGAAIDEIEREDGMIEVEYTLDGTMFELEIDPSTGSVVEIELEHGGDEDDDD